MRIKSAGQPREPPQYLPRPKEEFDPTKRYVSSKSKPFPFGDPEDEEMPEGDIGSSDVPSQLDELEYTYFSATVRRLRSPQ